MDKPEALRKLRALIKKYHPDGCRDESRRQLYTDISIRLIELLKKLQRSESRDDYHYYRAGMQAFRKIHPGALFRRGNRGHSERLSREEQEAAIERIMLSIDESLYYFGTLVRNFP